MIKRLIRTALIGIIGARIVPGVLTGTASMAASVLSAQVLFIVVLGFSPLLLVAATATPISASPRRLSA